METITDSITVIPSDFATGVEIRGVDLSHPIDETTFRTIEDTFNKHGVIYFRGQNLAPKQQLALPAASATSNRICTGILGMPDEEALPLLSELARHGVKPEFQYRHKWQVGDVLMWNNCTVQHMARKDYDLPLRRLMHRTATQSSAPF
ncbi:MAG: TauD/TfdA family dioxygenase [Rhodospirillales bacterium]